MTRRALQPHELASPLPGLTTTSSAASTAGRRFGMPPAGPPPTTWVGEPVAPAASSAGPARSRRAVHVGSAYSAQHCTTADRLLRSGGDGTDRMAHDPASPGGPDAFFGGHYATPEARPWSRNCAELREDQIRRASGMSARRMGTLRAVVALQG